MNAHTGQQTGGFADAIPGAFAWVWISNAAAVLAAAGNIAGLAVPAIYARLTPAFQAQAYAQDAANLALVTPAWLILAGITLRGSRRAGRLLLGVLLFTVYNYVIYTSAVPFGPLFLLWVAVLGLSFYALLGGAFALGREASPGISEKGPAIAAAGWLLLVVAVLFAALWLSEDVPALLSGSTPASVVELGIPTNIVHVLDLAFFLPAAALCGVQVLKGRRVGYLLAPGFLVFLILTGVPILLTPAVQSRLGRSANWGPAAPIGILSVILLGVLVWMLAARSRS